MPSSLLLSIGTTVLGLLVGSVVVFTSPRLVAHRLPEPPEAPGALVLIPLGGVWLARVRPLYNTVVEVVAAAVFLALSIHYGPSRRLLLALVYSTLLITIAYIDIDHRLVLNKLSYPGIVIALAGALLWPGFGIVNALIGAAVGFVIFAVFQIVGRGALGTGDTKLALMIGAMRGYPGVFDALLLGIVLGGLGALFFLMVLRRGRKEYIAYAPYLVAGAILSFFITSP